jgi:hypothetical protein
MEAFGAKALLGRFEHLLAARLRALLTPGQGFGCADHFCVTSPCKRRSFIASAAIAKRYPALQSKKE